MDKVNKLELRRIQLFLAFTFTITYAWTMLLVWPRVLGKDTAALTQEETAVNTMLIAVMMFFPAVGVLFTRLVTREGFKDSMLHLNLRGNVRYYLIAWIGPIVLTLLGTIAYYICFPSDFSLAAFRGLDIENAAMVYGTIVVMLFAPLFNLVPCLGEEWGWRGYLLPKLANRMSFLSAALLTGLIWGVWHAPIIVAGHNYGFGYSAYPWLGIAAMCVFCIVVGMLLAYVTLRTKSCWPAVLAHGAINGTAVLGMLFYNSLGFIENPNLDIVNSFIGPMPVGIIGGFAYIVVAVWIVLKMRKASN